MSLNHLKMPLLGASILYSGGILFGCFLYSIFPANLGKISVNNQYTWDQYFVHNMSMNLVFIFGFLTLGIITLVLLIVNGLLMGYMLAHSIKYNMFLKFFLLLAPHGIVEIPTLLIASSTSFFVILYLINKRRQKERIDYKYLSFTILKFIAIVSILTLIAGIIESNVTMI